MGKVEVKGRMADIDELLDQILEEMARIHRIRESVPGEYRYGRTLMLEAADQLDDNVGKAVKTMRRAREGFEGESIILKRLGPLKKNWAIMPSYLHGDPEHDLEEELKVSLAEGDFLQCETIIEDLEKLADKDVADNIEIGIVLEVPKPEVHLGRGTSLSVVLHNHSVFPIELMSLVCSSSQAGISVLNFFKGEMPPENDRTFEINVIPKVEGDIAVHIEAVTRSSNRLVPIKKAFSLRVVPPVIAQVVPMPQAAPAIVTERAALPASAPSSQAPSIFDPMGLVERGRVDDWVHCITTYAKGRTAVDLKGIVQNDPEYVKADGYANLYKALLAMNYDRSVDWEAWFQESGFIGEDYTRRCTKMLYRLASSPTRSLEIPMDGNVGSSNIENLIGAMQVASGEVRREERSRKAWKVEGEMAGKAFTLNIEKVVSKDENGKAVSTTFRILPSN